MYLSVAWAFLLFSSEKLAYQKDFLLSGGGGNCTRIQSSNRDDSQHKNQTIEENRTSLNLWIKLKDSSFLGFPYLIDPHHMAIIS